MLRNQRPKLIENEGRERQILHSSWSIFRAKMGMGLGAKIERFSETILESTKIDLDGIFGVKMGSQDRSPERVFQGSNFETRLLKKCTPPKRKPCFCMLTRSENGSIWGSKIDQKNVFFEIHFGSYFC